MEVKPVHADLSHIGFCDAISFSVIVTFLHCNTLVIGRAMRVQTKITKLARFTPNYAASVIGHGTYFSF